MPTVFYMYHEIHIYIAIYVKHSNYEQNYFMNYSFDRVNFLSVWDFNARSLLHKMDELKVLVVVHNPDVIFITEIWIFRYK